MYWKQIGVDTNIIYQDVNTFANNLLNFLKKKDSKYQTVQWFDDSLRNMRGLSTSIKIIYDSIKSPETL